VSVIRVNPESVHSYASYAQERFEQIRSDLEGLVRDVVSVRYFGPNAVQFKTECGQMAQGFSQKLLADLGQIAEAVSASTSNIADALGGAPVRIAVNGSSVTAPTVEAGDGSVDVDTSALEGLKPVVSSRFGSVEEALGSHLARLESTDWEGQAKQGAVEQVSGFTTAAKERASEAQTSLTRFIDRQIASVTAADK
jgi:hypothetical protein